MAKNIFVLSISIILVISLIIGFSLFYTYCDPKLRPNCENYYSTTGNIINKYIINSTCTNCTTSRTTCYNDAKHHSCVTKCVQYENYPCYNGYITVSYSYNETNKTCPINVDDDNPNFNYQNELNYIADFINNSEYTIHISKTDGECVYSLKPSGFGAAGFILMINAGFYIFLIFLIFLIQVVRASYGCIYFKNIEQNNFEVPTIVNIREQTI